MLCIAVSFMVCLCLNDGVCCSRGIIELGDVTSHNVKQLKRLNQAIFPVIYNDKFYKDVLQFGELVKLGIHLSKCYLFLDQELISYHYSSCSCWG